MNDERKIRVIPATNSRRLFVDDDSPIIMQKKKVAAYARVSTGREEQQTSFKSQMEYYTRLILSNPDWEMVGVYADEGISGRSMKKRAKFREMIKDALDGKIDMILVKSVSRFARNVLDSLTINRRCPSAENNRKTLGSKKAGSICRLAAILCRR